MTRIVRLIRLMMVMRLYRIANTQDQNDDARDQISELMKESEMDEDLAQQISKSMKRRKVMKKQMTMDMLVNDGKESTVGKKMIDQTTRKVIICFFLIILTFPLFKTETYIKEPDSLVYGMELLFRSKSASNKQRIFDDIVNLQKDMEWTPLVYL